MPETLLLLTMGEMPPLLQHPATEGRVAAADVYDLPRLDLQHFRGLLMGMHLDQRFLHAHRPQLDDFVRGGGRVSVNGQIAFPFLAGLSVFVPLRGYKLPDLAIARVAAHPVWEGVHTEDLTYRRGVAGFHGRGHHPPPSGARILHTLGPRRLPLDFEYAVGVGAVLQHGGNDIWSNAFTPTTAARATPQLFDWLEGRA